MLVEGVDVVGPGYVPSLTPVIVCLEIEEVRYPVTFVCASSRRVTVKGICN